jgi:hypothetical protein
MQTTRADWTEHRVPLITIAEQEHIVAELRRVEYATVQEQMQVVNWASQYHDYYYMTPSGSLRRVFPKGKLLRVKTRRHHASSQS